jgi:hypothetical protein
MEQRTQELLSSLRAAGKNRWLALKEEETAIIAESDSIEDVLERARLVGVEDPILIWSPEEWIPLVA